MGHRKLLENIPHQKMYILLELIIKILQAKRKGNWKKRN